MKSFVVITLLFLQVYGGKSPHGEEYLSSLSHVQRQALYGSVQEDSLLDVEGLLNKYGYPNEAHTVETEDGYLLKVHRITAGKNGYKAANKPPVFLMHGLLCSSSDWIIMGPESGLGYMLADEGYDVWMGNARGNFYSKAHTSLSPKDSNFWKFSWHEIGYYDLPAMIDYVLEKTNKTKLQYIGHSQGTTSFFVMGSERPEYNKKIISMQALAPVAYMSNAKSPIVRLLSQYVSPLELAFKILGINEILPHTPLVTEAANILCNEDSKYAPMCANLLFVISGFDSDLLNATMVPVIMSHTPAGSSVRQVIHYAQEYLSGKFRQFDHGVLNMLIYGKLSPPKYNLKYVTAPIALHYGDNDWLSEPIDVKQLYNELAKPIGMFRIPYDKFNHLDFLWAINVRELCYDNVLNIMKKYEV